MTIVLFVFNTALLSVQFVAPERQHGGFSGDGFYLECEGWGGGGVKFDACAFYFLSGDQGPYAWTADNSLNRVHILSNV